jgi:hypothetical protein
VGGVGGGGGKSRAQLYKDVNTGTFKNSNAFDGWDFYDGWMMKKHQEYTASQLTPEMT